MKTLSPLEPLVVSGGRSFSGSRLSTFLHQLKIIPLFETLLLAAYQTLIEAEQMTQVEYIILIVKLPVLPVIRLGKCKVVLSGNDTTPQILR